MLVRQGAVYHFRRRTPLALRAVLPKTEIWISLHTTNRKEAQTRAAVVWGLVELAMRSEYPPYTLEYYASAIKRAFEAGKPVHELASKLAEIAGPGFDYSTLDFSAERGRYKYEFLLEEYARQWDRDELDKLPSMDERLEVVARRITEKRTEERRRLTKEILEEYTPKILAEHTPRILAEHTPRILSEQTHKIGDADIQAIVAAVKAALIAEQGEKKIAAASPRFSEKIEEFIEYKSLPDAEGDGAWSAQTILQSRGTFRIWTDLMGDDRPVRMISRADANEFYKFVHRLPQSHGKSRIRISAVDAVEAAEKRRAAGESVPTIVPKTAKRHFHAMHQYWKFLQQNLQAVDDNIFAGFEFKGAKSQKRKRVSWPDDVLIKLFNSSWFDRYRLRSGYYWLPLVAAFSGMRAEEIARLRPNHDLRQIDDVWCFDIQEQPPMDGLKKWSPKSEAGIRVVPVHPKLIELGIIELAKDQARKNASRIFSDFKPSGPDQKLAAEFSRKFSKLKQSLVDNPKITFHSFRHNVRSQLNNAGFKDPWIDNVIGHAIEEGSVGAKVYTEAIGVAERFRVVSAIKYPVEFGKIKPFVPRNT